ncbi:DUF5597 domain-containing protein [Xanthomonas phaseoli pv. dieffenbachiae]|uniref:DUF5597 domain-containing protein n=1 Tax=Xanthomonas TaxID=338 RepID=UPI0006E59637|nr:MULTISPECIES: DUF5597 domain-containing protein [Xanthomonas]MBO9748527.1 DUF5597 domain-containing protein [Xanthomonas phaseoli pv. dieffenbachiae]MBO9751294.1 DUF5597 domain-containing protein [Xanthomonas phaseoli pv. dieffenbachiae]MBO9887971.1 DUF5597 domain-containing protein [Xanthomonas sp. D-36-1]OQP75936.1 beta-galactosidase [Xanthomonas citri]
MGLFVRFKPQRRCRLAALLWSLVMLAASAPLLASAEELPRLVTQNGRHALFVDGAPYTILAAQLHNSSAWPAVLPKALDEVVALHANTVEAPVYWEQFEPAQGRFDTSNVDALIAGARKRGLRVALLWFGSWKNGQMHYVPEWIKRDEATYPRMRDANGEPVDVLSPHVAANMQADARAFTALMRHLRKVDGDRHTVILVQVENEPGAIGTVRDHGPAGEAAFAQPVPAQIARALGKPQGSWQQLFGAEAAEAFNAYATAAYIEQVAAAGKRVYPLPFYVNTWLRYKGKRYPGMDYPSGGATVNVFALWRAATPSIDFIGTDIYTNDYNEYTKVIGQYARPDNPAWVSETGFEAATAPYLFHVLGQGGVGFSVFGMDGNSQRTLRFGDWEAKVSFGAPMWGDAPPILPGNDDHAGRLLVAQLGPEEFLVTGMAARIEFFRDAADTRHGQLLRVEQGRYVDGRWQMERQLNGDQTDYGLNFGRVDAAGNVPVVLRVRVGTY